MPVVGLRRVCVETGTIVIMDQVTHDALETGVPGLVFPEEYMLVVAECERHAEENLFKAAHALKKDLSRGVLSPARERVFRECTMMIMVLDEERHSKKALEVNHKWKTLEVNHKGQSRNSLLNCVQRKDEQTPWGGRRDGA